MSAERPDQILIVAPLGRDAELMCAQLSAHGLQCEACKDVPDLCERIPKGLGAMVLTEEALPPEAMHQLAKALADQPAWSEVPVVILTGSPSIEMRSRSFDFLIRRTNVTLVDRPVRIQSLVSTMQSALRTRQRQYDIRDLMEQLEERIHERDRFLAVLGHELRNPLGAILLASQMIDDDGKLDHEHAQLIERQSRHLTRLVNDLLDLSRVAAGKIVLKRQIVDLREIAAEAIRVMRPVAERQKLELRLA
ncbi:MAG TPA: histidine kinase dimerization/phospho-acceptor domain-containing protein, partial [Thermoanaerobaculia bacterium]|nr:histidine kinase dimerization/phospho-acceptor domain-containing protein [Thermoanaerobaculia bacterium]